MTIPKSPVISSSELAATKTKEQLENEIESVTKGMAEALTRMNKAPGNEAKLKAKQSYESYRDILEYLKDELKAQ
jgi:hypothetical protein